MGVERGYIITEFIDEDSESLAEPVAKPQFDSQNSHHDGATSDTDSLSEEPVEPEQSTFCSLDPRSIKLDRIGDFIAVAFLAVGALVAAGFSITLRQWIGSWWITIPIACLLLVLLLAWVAYFWPTLAYRHTKWRLVETGLEIHRGVLFRHQLSVPAARVQHVDVAQGPLQRKFELGSLIVHTAGTSNASVTLDGLAFDTAKELRDQLVRQRESLDVT